ncbi:MAG: sulfatase-like hydrolase/transferase [Lentisphaerae bacterium]|nr:sulfatase-like hydrolase/transferase [Lentisphaerota bacterium]
MQKCATRRPDIIFLTDDEHRWDFYGGGQVPGLQTPTIDRLKRRGVTLTNAVSNCPVCMPTRFTWLTGLYGSQSAAGPRNSKDWPHGHPTVAQSLQRAGYHTALIGKLHSHCGETVSRNHLKDLEKHTHDRGFDDVFECSGRGIYPKKGRPECRYTDYLKSKGLYDAMVADACTRDHRLGGTNMYSPSIVGVEDHFDNFVGREMIRWINDYSMDKPFFLHASFFGPHFPLDPPEPFFSRHRPDDMPPPAGVEDPERIKFWQKQRAAYCGLIEFTDYCMGKFLDALEARGLLENTIIIFASDHGDMMGDHNMFYKMKPYDASVRTPFIVCDPASVLPGGTVLQGLAEAVDIPATILAAGSDEHLQDAMPCSPGRSFLEYVRGGAGKHREWAYAEQGNLGEGGSSWRMVRTAVWKYVFAEKGDMLFNLPLDPFEQRNLVDEPGQQERVKAMRGLLIQRMGSLLVPPATVTSNVSAKFYKGVAESILQADQSLPD